MAKTSKNRIVRMGKSRNRRNRRNRSVKRRKRGGNGVITYYQIEKGQYRSRTNETGWTGWQSGNPINKSDGYWVQDDIHISKHTGEGI